MAATPRMPRGSFVEAGRSDVAAATWIFRGGASRRRRGSSAETRLVDSRLRRGLFAATLRISIEATRRIDSGDARIDPGDGSASSVATGRLLAGWMRPHGGAVGGESRRRRGHSVDITRAAIGGISTCGRGGAAARLRGLSTWQPRWRRDIMWIFLGDSVERRPTRKQKSGTAGIGSRTQKRRGSR